MDFLTHLWLPIVASSVAAWVTSAVKRMGIPPGSYGFPEFRRLEGLSKAEKQAKWDEMQQSPIGLLRVWGPINMGRNMLLTFVVSLAASILIGYLGWHALPHGAAAGEARPEFANSMQVLGTAGILAYCFAGLPNDIWFQRSIREVVTGLVDGVACGLITGAVFAWLWPT